MEVKVSHFFIPENAVGEAEGLDYSQVEPLIRTAEALAQTIYQSVYIIDYLKQGFLYVSDNPLFLCGQTRQEVLDAGYEFYLKHVPKEELDMLREINTAGFRFFNEIPKEERLGVSISYDFHLMAGNRKILINHKLTPLMLAKDGRVWLAVCVVSFSDCNIKISVYTCRKNLAAVVINMFSDYVNSGRRGEHSYFFYLN